MDRRDALKKLGAGGAVVAATTVVPVFQFSAAASGLPPQPDPLPDNLITVERIGDPWQAEAFRVSVHPVPCGGTTVTPSVSWSIQAATGRQSLPSTDPEARRLGLRKQNGTIESVFLQGPPVTVFVPWLENTIDFVSIAPSNGAIYGMVKEEGFTVFADLTRTCDGVEEATARYRIVKELGDILGVSQKPPVPTFVGWLPLP